MQSTYWTDRSGYPITQSNLQLLGHPMLSAIFTQDLIDSALYYFGNGSELMVYDVEDEHVVYYVGYVR